MSAAEKLVRSEALKEQGNATLKAGQLKHARTKYLKAMRILDQTFDFEGDEQVVTSLLCLDHRASCICTRCSGLAHKCVVDCQIDILWMLFFRHFLKSSQLCSGFIAQYRHEGLAAK